MHKNLTGPLQTTMPGLRSRLVTLVTSLSFQPTSGSSRRFFGPSSHRYCSKQRLEHLRPRRGLHFAQTLTCSTVPNYLPFLSSFSLPTYQCLAVPYINSFHLRSYQSKSGHRANREFDRQAIPVSVHRRREFVQLHHVF